MMFRSEHHVYITSGRKHHFTSINVMPITLCPSRLTPMNPVHINWKLSIVCERTERKVDIHIIKTNFPGLCTFCQHDANRLC